MKNCLNSVMNSAVRNNAIEVETGIEIIGKIAWGSHFCMFYKTQADFLNIIIPYFKLGLENNEICVWIQHEDENIVYQGLKKAIDKLDDYVKQGRMLFFDRDVCFKNACAETADILLNDLIEKQNEVLAQGYAGLRLAGGPTNFFNRLAWDNFAAFESCVDNAFYNRKIIALCCYKLNECDPNAIVDVIKSHQFALVHRNNHYEMVENSSLKVLKKELIEQNLELERRVNERTQELQNALIARDQFLSTASHELKTPITCLRIYIDGMLRNLPEKAFTLKELYPILNKVHEQSICIEKFINRLLDVTYILKNGSLHIEKENIDIVHITKDIIEQFSEAAMLAGCDLVLQAPPQLFGHWDLIRIRQMISNLIANTLKYAPGKPVIIHIAQQDHVAVFSIKDHGEGIPDHSHKKIFGRFVQLHDNKSGEGFGLGLWLVKQIVDAHQGTIALESELNKGTRFIITIPLSKDNLT